MIDPESLRKKELDFCFECQDFPCENLKSLDSEYQSRYKTSLINNLKRIKKIGVDKWIDEQVQLFTCVHCGANTSIHEEKCYFCNQKI